MISNDWLAELGPEFKKPYYAQLYEFVKNEYNTKQVFPPSDEIFTAFHLTPLSQVKVVIIGQDPYHGVGEAHGLSFSVRDGVKLPPSLKNIYKELESDLGIINSRGDLTSWAKEGVLLLNSVLSVRKDTPASHKNIGWELFTDYVISKVNEKEEGVVFVLWGNFARNKKELITNPKHLIIESVHPSPFSARNGFFGSKPFSRCNKILVENGLKPINWEVK